MSQNFTNLLASGFVTDANSDPDFIPIAMPDGIISFCGIASTGTYEVVPIVNFKVACGGQVIEGAMNISMAQDMRAALVDAIAAAESAANDFEAEI